MNQYRITNISFPGFQYYRAVDMAPVNNSAFILNPKSRNRIDYSFFYTFLATAKYDEILQLLLASSPYCAEYNKA